MESFQLLTHESVSRGCTNLNPPKSSETFLSAQDKMKVQTDIPLIWFVFAKGTQHLSLSEEVLQEEGCVVIKITRHAVELNNDDAGD